MHINMRYRRALVGIGLAVAVAMTPVAMSRQSLAEAKGSAPAPTKLKVGDSAPDFTLLAFDGKEVKPVSLHDYKGKKNVALAFYVFAFTGGWTAEMKAFQKNLATLEGANTQVLGVSMDSPFSNFAFAQQNGITFPLLGDFGGKVTQEYGLTKKYDMGGGASIESARRATYLIDESGKIVEMQVEKDAVDPTKIVEACQRRKLKD